MLLTTDMMDSHSYFLKPKQVETMRDAAYRGSFGDRDDAIVTLGDDTGLRRNELRQLNRNILDLDLDAPEFLIPVHRQTSSTNDNTSDPVTGALDTSQHLRTVPTFRADTGDALFPSLKSDRLTAKRITDVGNRRTDRSGVRPSYDTGRGDPDDVSAHTLRHSVASRMVRSTASGSGSGSNTHTLSDVHVRNRIRHATILTTHRQDDNSQTISLDD